MSTKMASTSLAVDQPSTSGAAIEDLSLVRTRVLVFISHARSPPLDPAPHLEYDVRSLPLPPKRVVDWHKHIRVKGNLVDWMVREPEFVKKRDEIREDILEGMAKFGLGLDDPTGNEDEVKEKEDEDESGEGDKEELATATSGIDGEGKQKFEYRVGVSCVTSRQRSAAMVEELALLSWPGWEVKVQHRDVVKKKESEDYTRDKSRGIRGDMTGYADDYEEE